MEAGALAGPRAQMTALWVECRQLWRLRALLAVLTRRELAARFAGSAGGVLWVWLPPLLTIAAYFLVFDVVFGMRLGASAPTGRVGTYLIVGMLPWMAFADATQRGMTSLLYAGSHHFAPGVWALLPLLALQGVLALLAGYLLAILAAALRDVLQLVGVALSLGVFLSPVLFPATLFPERWRWLLWLNPMTAPVLGYQSMLLQGQWPPLMVWLVLGAWLVAVAALLNVLLARSREHLVDWL